MRWCEPVSDKSDWNETSSLCSYASTNCSILSQNDEHTAFVASTDLPSCCRDDWTLVSMSLIADENCVGQVPT